jgi:ABC-2 type transport system ATP-binding protein
VLDAVLQGDAVRVVTEQARPLGCDELGASVTCKAVPPRFEDGFIARLKARHAPVALPSVAKVAGQGDEAISVDSLTKRFGDFTAVHGLTFAVRSGEVFGLLGANGAGKTTTFRMLCGLLPATAGHLRVAGVDLRRAAAKARGRIGYMSQKFSLYGNLSVRQNLDFFARAYGLRGQRVRERLHWALSAFELTDFADAESGALSLGYRQRLAMAAALLHEPEILFLDEPTSGVDPLARREFWAWINALAEHGVTVLVTTHFMEEAEYCDRLVIMAAGELLAVGTPAEIKARAATGHQATPTMEDAFIALIAQREAA